MKSDLFGLVMTGGGARGAYQAGVLKRIAELFKGKPSPFQVVTGASAGAINGVMMAAGAEDFYGISQKLSELWGTVQAKQVFRTDMGSMSSIASKWVTDLTFGGVVGGGRVESLLDARPLKEFLSSHISFQGIQNNIDSGILKALCVVATNYTNGKAYLFIQGYKGHPLWTKSRRVTEATKITADHILASAAIPIMFQPVPLETQTGKFYFGDGCLRLTTPLSPAIRLGANKLLAIGVRSTTSSTPNQVAQEPSVNSPPIAQVIGVMMNAIFLDHLDADVEHLSRINEMLKKQEIHEIKSKEPVKELEILAISPSVDLGALAMHYTKEIPTLVRYMLKGLGSKESETSDLMSYLLFAPAFANELMDIGYKDADRKIQEIKEFFKI